MVKKPMKDTLLLIDANSIIHRAYHALPPFTAPDGRPSGALYGLTSILIKVFRERPFQYGAAAFDRPEPTFREQEFKAYKATRPVTPDALISQLKEARSLFTIFGIKVLEEPGFEADDIVATLAHRLGDKNNLQIVALSGDLDLLQIVRDKKVVVETPKKGISNTLIYDEAAVEERFGIPPTKLPDFKGLTGDTSDNLPGVPGVGPKTATELISRYGSLENLYQEISEVGMENEKLREKLLSHKNQALLSKKLVILKTDLPLDFTLESLKTTTPFASEQVIDYLRSWGFESLVRRITGDTG